MVTNMKYSYRKKSLGEPMASFLATSVSQTSPSANSDMLCSWVLSVAPMLRGCSIVLLSLPSPGSDTGVMTIDALIAATQVHMQWHQVRGASAVDSNCLVPLCGYESFPGMNQPVACMPIEVYKSRDGGVAIVNVRSHCIQGKTQAFSHELLELLQSSACSSSSTSGPIFVALAGLGDEDVEDEHQVFRIGSMYVSKNAEAKRWLQTDASGNDVDNQVNRKLAALIATFEEFRVVRPSDLTNASSSCTDGTAAITCDALVLTAAPPSLESADFDRVPPRSASKTHPHKDSCNSRNNTAAEPDEIVLLQLLPRHSMDVSASSSITAASDGNFSSAITPLTPFDGSEFETDVALSLLRLITLNSRYSRTSPFILLGGCCRIAHRFDVSKRLALSIASALHLLPPAASSSSIAMATPPASTKMYGTDSLDQLLYSAPEPASWSSARVPIVVHGNDYF